MISTQTIPKRYYNYIAILFVIAVVVRIVLIGFYNNNLGGIEPNVVYGIQRLLLGQPLYQDPASGTYGIIQYTPLHYTATAAVGRLLHVSGLDAQGVYMLCRSLALVFNLLTVLLVAGIIRGWGFSRGQAIVLAMPALLLLTSHYYTRGDSMHLLFFVGALYAYIRYSKGLGLYNIIIAALCTAACIAVKQSGILSFGIIGFYLFFMARKPLHAIVYGIAVAFFGIFIIKACTDGNWVGFYRNAYLGLKNGIDPSFLYNMFINQFFLDLVACYVLGGILAWAAVRQIHDKTFGLLAAGAALSFLFAVTTGLKIGSSNNYFVEFLVFITIALPFFLQSATADRTFFHFRKKPVTLRRFAYIAFIIMLSSKVMALSSGVFIERSIKNHKEDYMREMALNNYFEKELHIQQGEYIYFNSRGFLDNLFVKYAIMPNKDVVQQVYTANPATYDYSAFIKGMNTGLIKYLVTPTDKDDLNVFEKDIPFIKFDRSKFRLMAQRNGFNVYVFNG